MADELKKAPSRTNKPRPAYLLVNLPEGVTAADIDVVDCTRKAEDALAAIDGGDAGAYIRVMIK